jgi:hypothetical protein
MSSIYFMKLYIEFYKTLHKIKVNKNLTFMKLFSDIWNHE